ncbi:dihydrofolate reductase [Confluentibacter flavum]|uniref:dihydrofolate reductase n=1 Tax=Confluentibacter flavum TaxID=1909700 RepID=A0A2N3HFH1_9FLAO|nr:dihydrofolate reductase [Confluentibacter flavum]PKQ43726.1 dihydrofolate reductase [Confluentibacter flavum]
MFGKRNTTPQIEKEQLELLKNAQKRIKQKKRLYIHFVIFLIGAVFLIIANTLLGIGEGITFFGKEWFVYAILIWFFLFIYHIFNVFITHKFMGKSWEEEQLQKLVSKQKERIGQLEQKVEQEIAHKNSEKKKSELTLIVAAAENNAIGKDNKLIWYLSDDLKRFKTLTNGHHIIMGRKTFESFPKPLPNRTHVVITRQDNYHVPDGVIVVNSLEDALDASKNDSQPFVIGGGDIYKQAMTIADKIEITKVHETFEADTFFPEIDTTVWKEIVNTFHQKDENNEYDCSFITYVRY